MPVEIKETLEEIRNRLLTTSRQEKEEQRAGYVNGILDMYNETKRTWGEFINSAKD